MSIAKGRILSTITRSQHVLQSTWYLGVAVVLGHAALLLDEEGMEDIQVVKRGPGRQHQPVLTDIQNQRAGRHLRQRGGGRGVLEPDQA